MGDLMQTIGSVLTVSVLLGGLGWKFWAMLQKRMDRDGDRIFGKLGEMDEQRKNDRLDDQESTTLIMGRLTLVETDAAEAKGERRAIFAMVGNTSATSDAAAAVAAATLAAANLVKDAQAVAAKLISDTERKLKGETP